MRICGCPQVSRQFSGCYLEVGRFGATLRQTCLPRELRIENLFFHIEIFQLVTEEMQSCEKEEVEKQHDELAIQNKRVDSISKGLLKGSYLVLGKRMESLAWMETYHSNWPQP